MNESVTRRFNITELRYCEKATGSELLCTSEGAPFTGTVYEALPSGSMTAEYEIKEGLKNGLEKNYYSEGIIEQTAYYREGQLHGDVIYYYSDGLPKEKSVFEYDICIEEFEWSENGELIHHKLVALEKFQYAMLERLRREKRW
jgi:antitoxin component YwqK of YwqJK toxin-antitoxin module